MWSCWKSCNAVTVSYITWWICSHDTTDTILIWTKLLAICQDVPIIFSCILTNLNRLVRPRLNWDRSADFQTSDHRYMDSVEWKQFVIFELLNVLVRWVAVLLWLVFRGRHFVSLTKIRVELSQTECLRRQEARSGSSERTRFGAADCCRRCPSLQTL